MALPMLCADFAFEGQSVRLIRNGELWWVLADICQVLEIDNPRNVAARLDQDEKGVHTMDTLGGPQEMLIVSEPGLYKLIGTSRKPVAKRFDRWVRHEVLPSIRKTGSYTLPGTTPPAVVAIEQQIGDLFRRELDPLKNDLRQLRSEVKEISGNVIVLANKGRRDPTTETIRQHGKIIRHHYFCKCPCGECDIPMMDDEGFISGVMTYHHQNNRWDNRPTATIPLARPCHERIERDAEARIRFLRHYEMFQALLARHPLRQPRLPGL